MKCYSCLSTDVFQHSSSMVVVGRCCIQEYYWKVKRKEKYGIKGCICRVNRNTVEGTNTSFYHHGNTRNLPDLNSTENLWSVVQRKTTDSRPDTAGDPKAASKTTYVFTGHCQDTSNCDQVHPVLSESPPVENLAD